MTTATPTSDNRNNMDTPNVPIHGNRAMVHAVHLVGLSGLPEQVPAPLAGHITNNQWHALKEQHDWFLFRRNFLFRICLILAVMGILFLGAAVLWWNFHYVSHALKCFFFFMVVLCVYGCHIEQPFEQFLVQWMMMIENNRNQELIVGKGDRLADGLGFFRPVQQSLHHFCIPKGTSEEDMKAILGETPPPALAGLVTLQEWQNLVHGQPDVLFPLEYWNTCCHAIDLGFGRRQERDELVLHFFEKKKTTPCDVELGTLPSDSSSDVGLAPLLPPASTPHVCRWNGLTPGAHPLAGFGEEFAKSEFARAFMSVTNSRPHIERDE